MHDMPPLARRMLMSGCMAARPRSSGLPPLEIGHELDERWRLVRIIGEGGSSTVYEAVHRNGRRAAIKLLSRSAERSSHEARKLATTESTIANRLGHPAFVEVFDDRVTPEGIPYLVMELLEGVTLERLRRAEGGRIPLAQALPILESILEALVFLHQAGFHHRDVKPTNVFVLDDGRVKILDYGLASAEEGLRGRSARLVGTPGYMSPEQARGEWWRVDALSDQWSAAATAFAVLTGRLVHEGSTSEELLLKASTCDVDLGESGLPVEIVAVLERALAFDRTARFPDVHAMLSVLRTAATNGFHYASGVMRAIRPLPTSDSAAWDATIRPTTLPAIATPTAPNTQPTRRVHRGRAPRRHRFKSRRASS